MSVAFEVDERFVHAFVARSSIPTLDTRFRDGTMGTPPCLCRENPPIIPGVQCSRCPSVRGSCVRPLGARELLPERGRTSGSSQPRISGSYRSHERRHVVHPQMPPTREKW
jgi:hypothetical protein